MCCTSVSVSYSMFADRSDAGRQLARMLLSFRGREVVVLGLPRGGVPVAVEVAAALDVALDVVVVRKLGVPFQPELAMGAIGEGGIRVLDNDTIATIGITADQILEVETREREVLEARVAALRRGRARIDLNGRTAVIVDDGLATGSTARVACQVARRLGAARVIVGVPVAPAPTVASLPEADEVVCVLVPRPFGAVGVHYRDFRPVPETEVLALLDAASQRAGGPPQNPAAG
jgi:putative phosphoribosyl transferase